MKKNHELFMVFVNLTKLVIHDKILSAVIFIHRSTEASGISDGGCPDLFTGTNGSKQRCIMAPALFALYFSILLDFTFRNSNTTSDFVLQMGYLIISGLKIKP